MDTAAGNCGGIDSDSRWVGPGVGDCVWVCFQRVGSLSFAASGGLKKKKKKKKKKKHRRKKKIKKNLSAPEL
eukprot:NODE_31805_length_389_cov_2.022901.p3 GENE.NODE_31805_length_389_cov_2.022901~~NODE_31805_length_389_cov_2.022901.p3  ORF type:complete len:72 (-),score=34.52 NODE_31805_length_389_cov_2.022901:18-233(-)